VSAPAGDPGRWPPSLARHENPERDVGQDLRTWKQHREEEGQPHEAWPHPEVVRKTDDDTGDDPAAARANEAALPPPLLDQELLRDHMVKVAVYAGVRPSGGVRDRLAGVLG
jgi:hypothetical protein